MLLPALNKARQAAYNNNCKGNLKQVYMVNYFYASDYDSWALGERYASFGSRASNVKVTWFYEIHLHNYAPYKNRATMGTPKESSIFKCAAEQNEVGSGIPATNFGINTSMDSMPPLTRSLGYKSWGSDSVRGLFKLDTVMRASEIGWFADVAPNKYGFYMSSSALPGSSVGCGDYTTRHGQHLNMAFVDGHVQQMQISYLEAVRYKVKYPYYYRNNY